MEIRDAPSFLQYYTRIRYRTKRVIQVIPEEKLEWSYQTGRFTPGDLI